MYIKLSTHVTSQHDDITYNHHNSWPIIFTSVHFKAIIYRNDQLFQILGTIFSISIGMVYINFALKIYSIIFLSHFMCVLHTLYEYTSLRLSPGIVMPTGRQ